MQTMHLFAGSGGGLLGDLILGHTPICAVEWDKYACNVLRERVNDGWFEGMQVYEGDIRLFDPSEYAGRVDCIHAGFPCQDISVAGKQAGVGEDTRSGLYREVLRIADVVRPRELFMENVSAILSNGLGTVLADLSARGYSARWMCLRASDIGANHHRDRWWLLARRGDVSSHAEHNRLGWWKQFAESASKTAFCDDVADSDSADWRASCMGQDSMADRRDEFSGCGEIFSDPSSIRQSGQGEFEQSIGSETDCNREANRTINGSENHIEWWQSEPDVGRVADGVADRMGKLKALGNGQVPLQMAVAYSILEELFNA